MDPLLTIIIAVGCGDVVALLAFAGIPSEWLQYI
jgi:hypothetical protein